jgi:hypothetical protein
LYGISELYPQITQIHCRFGIYFQVGKGTLSPLFRALVLG